MTRPGAVAGQGKQSRRAAPGVPGKRRGRLPHLIQKGLERLYRIDCGLDVRDFLLGEEERGSIVGRGPREQLLVQHDEDGLWLGLFLDPRVLRNLEDHDPRRQLDDRNLSDLCLSVEGVSHFLYVVWRARQEHPVSPLELELQGEVDKYATCLLTLLGQRDGPPPELWQALFARFALDGALSVEERERYLTANQQAGRYAEELDRCFVKEHRLDALLAELRFFYRLGWREKVERIALIADRH
jgi:hypothetical protein